MSRPMNKDEFDSAVRELIAAHGFIVDRKAPSLIRNRNNEVVGTMPDYDGNMTRDDLRMNFERWRVWMNKDED